jgi:hypothetical protein
MDRLVFGELSSGALFAAGELWAADGFEFHRGPGFYFSLLKIPFLLIGFFLWIYVCNAVQRDSDVAEFTADRSNALLLSAGILGLGMVWLCPSIWVSLLGMTVLVVCGVVAYAWERDRRVAVPWLRPIKKMVQKFFGADVE